jgi:hypothetical protein
MKKLAAFLKGFGLCFILSIICWMIIGGLFSLFIPSFTITEILSEGITTGIGFGLINGFFYAFY